MWYNVGTHSLACVPVLLQCSKKIFPTSAKKSIFLLTGTSGKTTCSVHCNCPFSAVTVNTNSINPEFPKGFAERGPAAFNNCSASVKHLLLFFMTEKGTGLNLKRPNPDLHLEVLIKVRLSLTSTVFWPSTARASFSAFRNLFLLKLSYYSSSCNNVSMPLLCFIYYYYFLTSVFMASEEK